MRYTHNLCFCYLPKIYPTRKEILCLELKYAFPLSMWKRRYMRREYPCPKVKAATTVLLTTLQL